MICEERALLINSDHWISVTWGEIVNVVNHPSTHVGWIFGHLFKPQVYQFLQNGMISVRKVAEIKSPTR